MRHVSKVATVEYSVQAVRLQLIFMLVNTRLIYYQIAAHSGNATTRDSSTLIEDTMETRRNIVTAVRFSLTTLNEHPKNALLIDGA